MNPIETLLRDHINAIIHKGPVTELEIAQAEQELGIQFSEDLKTYLKICGCLSYKSRELYGLGVPETSYLNIVGSTKEMRRMGLPHTLVVVEELGEGHYAVCDTNDEIHEWSLYKDKVFTKKISPSFSSYLAELFAGE